MLLHKNGFDVIFFPSRRQSMRGFVCGSDCRQKVEHFSSRALNVVLNIFSLSTDSAPAVLADSSSVDPTVEVLWDSTAGRLLPSGLQSRSDPSHPDSGESTEVCKREHGFAKGNLFA